MKWLGPLRVNVEAQKPQRGADLGWFHRLALGRRRVSGASQRCFWDLCCMNPFTLFAWTHSLAALSVYPIYSGKHQTSPATSSQAGAFQVRSWPHVGRGKQRNPRSSASDTNGTPPAPGFRKTMNSHLSSMQVQAAAQEDSRLQS